jgi:hypothetical protein
VTRMRVYAWLCKQLRNHIHDGILAVDAHPGRSYGSSKNVALNIGRIPALAPGADNDMTQAHYDALGVWHTEPMSPFDGPSMVADLATTGFTLMRAGLEYVEAFTKLIVRNKPQRMLDAENAASEGNSTLSGESETNSFPSRFLGCVQAQPGEFEPPATGESGVLQRVVWMAPQGLTQALLSGRMRRWSPVGASVRDGDHGGSCATVRF